MKKCILFLSVFLMLGSFRAFLQAEEKSYSCYRLTIEPLLDGKIRDDRAWENIPEETGFVKLGTTSLASKQTFFQMGYTAKALYIGVKCQEPEMEKIKAKLKDMEDLWTEDSIEIFLFPQGVDNYYLFIINAIGSRWSYEFVQAFASGPKIPLGNWQAKTHQGEDYWSVEIRIPWEIFLTIPGEGKEWRGNLARNILTSGDHLSSWAHLKQHFHERENFGRLLFADKLSAEETRKTRDRISINILREEIVTNLKSLSGYKKEVAGKVEEYPALEREIVSFLKNYEEIENELPQLDTVEKAQLLLQKSGNLLKEADELRSKILREALFR